MPYCVACVVHRESLGCLWQEAYFLPRILPCHFFLTVFFKVMFNRLCKRGTACSLCNCVHLPTRFGHSVFSFYIIIFDCTEYMYFLMQRLKGFSKQIIRFLCVDVCFCCCWVYRSLSCRFPRDLVSFVHYVTYMWHVLLQLQNIFEMGGITKWNGT